MGFSMNPIILSFHLLQYTSYLVVSGGIDHGKGREAGNGRYLARGYQTYKPVVTKQLFLGWNGTMELGEPPR
jgi:hypothetical protein